MKKRPICALCHKEIAKMNSKEAKESPFDNGVIVTWEGERGKMKRQTWHIKCMEIRAETLQMKKKGKFLL